MSKDTLSLGGFHPGLVRLISIAKDLGWTAHQSKASHKGRGGVRLHSPVTAKVINVPESRQYAADKMNSLFNQVFTHSDPDTVTRVLGTLEGAVLQEHGDITGVDLSAVSNVEKWLQNEPLDADPLPTTTRPWLAKQGDDLYESSAVLEVVQDGRVIGYRCAVTECDYESDQPHSVAAHYRRKRDDAHEHHRPREPIVGKNPDPPAPKTGEYTPSTRLVRLLAHALQEVMDGSDFTADTLAEAALRWAHTRPDLERVEREPRELTAEEIVERIRSLVLSDEVPVLRGQVESLSEKVQTLASDGEAVQAQANEWQARAEKAESDLATLIDLVSSLKKA